MLRLWLFWQVRLHYVVAWHRQKFWVKWDRWWISSCSVAAVRHCAFFPAASQNLEDAWWWAQNVSPSVEADVQPATCSSVRPSVRPSALNNSIRRAIARAAAASAAPPPIAISLHPPVHYLSLVTAVALNTGLNRLQPSPLLRLPPLLPDFWQPDDSPTTVDWFCQRLFSRLTQIRRVFAAVRTSVTFRVWLASLKYTQRWANLFLPSGIQMPKGFKLQGPKTPRPGILCLCTPQRAPRSDPRYRLALRARHVCSPHIFLPGDAPTIADNSRAISSRERLAENRD